MKIPRLGRRQVKIGLFALGILITVFAWFLDNLAELTPVLEIFGSDYLSASKVLDELDQGDTGRVPVESDGVQVLLDRWTPPVLPETRRQVTFIGRSTGIFNINSGIHRYELRLLADEDGTQFFREYIWNSADARTALQVDFSSGLFKWKGILFFCGVILSTVAGIWEFRDETKSAEKQDSLRQEKKEEETRQTTN